MDLWLLRGMFPKRPTSRDVDVPDPQPPADSLDDLIRADDDQATAEARSDGMAVVRFWTELATAEPPFPDDLASDLTRLWLESYLDGTPCDD